jgi:hypothetical protein
MTTVLPTHSGSSRAEDKYLRSGGAYWIVPGAIRALRAIRQEHLPNKRLTPFLRDGFVPGRVLHDAAAARTLSGDTERGRAGKSFIEALVSLHAVGAEHGGIG